MRMIMKPRGGGKTTEILREMVLLIAAGETPILVCGNTTEAQRLTELAKHQYPQVPWDRAHIAPAYESIKGRRGPVLIDQLDWVLEAMYAGRVHAVTVSMDEVTIIDEVTDEG